jgi:Ca2+-binding RTX toxin-like protein
VIIGAREADPNGLDKAGAAYVVFGKAAFDPTINLSDLNTLDGSNGFVINGEAAGDLLGESLSSAGDVNGDGFQDIIVGALGANGYTGTSYVIFGSAQPFSANFDLSQLDGTNGFAIEGINSGDVSGFSVSSAGDFDGNGFGDLLVAAPGANTAAGETYLIFGKQGGFDASINLSELDGTNGFALKGVNAYDFSGISVGATDIDGDGFSDLIIGASYGDPKDKTNAGETYVIYGYKPIIGDAGNNSLFGTVNGDTIFGRDGNDSIFGSEGVNTMYGEDGNDKLYGGSNADYMYGGNGNDDLYGAGGNNKLFGDAGNDEIYSGSGDDLIDGGIGKDTIWLGGGKDTVVLALGNGLDTIYNFQDGQTTLGLSGGLKFEDLAISQKGNNTLIEIANGGEDLARLFGVQASSIDSSNFVIV